MFFGLCVCVCVGGGGGGYICMTVRTMLAKYILHWYINTENKKWIF